MTVLNDSIIKYQLDKGNIGITPRPKVIQPASVDLHLGPNFYCLEAFTIDRYHPERPTGPEMSPKLGGQWAVLYHGDFLICATLEWVELPTNIIGILTGKSTLARDGLQIECAGYVDPGWKGNLTLELVNLGPAPIVLRPGQPICQIRFQYLALPAERPYGSEGLDSHYQGSEGAKPGFYPATPPPTTQTHPDQ